VWVQIVAGDATAEDLVAVAAEVTALPAGVAAQLPPQTIDFGTGVQPAVDPDGPAVANVRRSLEAIGATWRGVDADPMLGDLAVASSPGDGQITVAIGRTAIARPVEDPQTIFESDAGRTVRWWGPNGRNYELTIGGIARLGSTLTANDLAALVRSFEPDASGVWHAPRFGVDARATTTVAG
jgi:hypothetical protein